MGVVNYRDRGELCMIGGELAVGEAAARKPRDSLSYIPTPVKNTKILEFCLFFSSKLTNGVF